MGKEANDATSTANNDDTAWQKSALNSYNSDIGNYMSNVNAALAAGNPYQSKSFLTNQNIATSGAMDSANTEAAGALRNNAARTGDNSASTAATIASNARAGQRDLTTYDAARDNANDELWQQQKQQLLGDQLQGANSQAGIYSTATSGDDAALGDMTNLQDSEDQMWSGIAGSALGGAGMGAGIAMK